MSDLTLRPRTTSPYSRSHLRSHSAASSMSAPPITRSHSSPIMGTSSPLGRPASPLHSATRRVSPLRRPMEESPSYSSFSGMDTYQTISENSELDITPRQPASNPEDATGTPHTPSSPFSAHGTFPRTRRRPSSPLTLPASMLTPPGSRLHTSTSSPALRSPSSPATAAKYNEAFPSTTLYASSIASSGLSTVSGGSSIPSTPTSFRSRSPSISSLETIPDTPDAEQAAVEQAEKETKEREKEKELGAAMENQGLGVVRGRGRVRDGRGGERKRWSVCGAERRGDLDVIWED